MKILYIIFEKEFYKYIIYKYIHINISSTHTLTNIDNHLQRYLRLCMILLCVCLEEGEERREGERGRSLRKMYFLP